MRTKWSFLITSVGAIITGIWLFPCMYHNVPSDIFRTLHDLRTIRTSKQFFTKFYWIILQNNQIVTVICKCHFLFRWYNYFYIIIDEFPWIFLMCFWRLTFWLDAKSQYTHLNGFSPVCIIMCLFMLALIVDFTSPSTILGQNGHSNL